MKYFKKLMRFGLFTILFIVVSLITLFLLKSQYPINDNYEPTISINEVENLSNTEIAERLLTMYLEHYKAKPIFDNQRIENYKIKAVSEVCVEEEGIAFAVLYLIKQHFWNDYWEFDGRMIDGMAKNSHFVSLIKEKDQFRLKIKGTAPPIPKK